MYILSWIKKLFEVLLGLENVIDKLRGKWRYIIRTFSGIGVFVIILLEYYGFRDIISIQIDTMRFGLFAEILLEECLTGVSVALLYTFVIKEHLLSKLTDIQLEERKDYFPIVIAVEEIWGYLFDALICAKIIVDVVLCMAGESVLTTINILIYFGLIFEKMFYLMSGVYYKIKNNYEVYKTEYTDFLDTDGKRIPRDGMVAYEGRLYNLYYADKEWWLSRSGNMFFEKDILLETAAKNKNGELKVY